MKKIFLFLLCLPILVNAQNEFTAFIESNKNTIQNTTTEISDVAQTELQDFLQKIPINQLSDYGFSSEDELKNVIIGKPIGIITLHNNTIVHSQQWKVPLIVNNQFIALLTVGMENEKWHIVALGANGLANELNNLINKSTPNHDYFILRIYLLKCDLLVSEKNTVLPFQSSIISLGLSKEKKYTTDQILPLIKNNIQNLKKY
jgi:hypothetical protein